MDEITITPIKNGPYKVVGKVRLVDHQGIPYVVKETFILCRCGQSSTKPFCDSTHRKVGFVAEQTASAAPPSALPPPPAAGTAAPTASP